MPTKTITTNGTAPDNYYPGLEGIIAEETRLSLIDGLKGKLIIAGFPLEEIAERASFEEMVYLLWHDRLPTAAELTDFQTSIRQFQTLPDATVQLLQAVAEANKPVMDALRIGAGTLDIDLPVNAGIEERAALLLARMPTVVATYWRLRHGQAPVQPNPEAGFAENYLAMLFGEEPSPSQIRGMETYLNTVIEHGLNASTFSARVIIATQTDLTSAIVGAIGALKGPLHGGAPGPALDTVFEIGTPERAESVLREKLERSERLMGFGHRVYKVYDPRAAVLSRAAQRLFEEDGDSELYLLAQHVEEVAIKLLEEAKPGRNLQTNVEFYTALLLHGIGLDTELFTPTFAISRTGGWLAHCMEHLAGGRLIRPKARYTGDQNRAWVPIAVR